MIDYRSFRTVLADAHGPAGLAVRHELFAHAITPTGWRSKPAQSLRTFLVMLRDLFRLLRVQPAARIPAGHYVAAVSLPGASGWGTLRETITALGNAGSDVTLVLHPRLAALPGYAGPLARPSLRSPRKILAAIRAGLRHRGRRTDGLSIWAVRLAVIRLELWRAAWRDLLGSGKPVLLHNDFDVFSTAAIGAGRRSLCLQHGLPTDEFFPCQADAQIVWSDACAAAYAAQGCAPPSLHIRRFRTRTSPHTRIAMAAPAGIALLSQTHATAILPDIAERLGSLASNLHNTEIPIQILLHPEEVRTGHPYPEHLRPLLSKPPHALSTGDSKPWLVVGLLSTALLEMAERGHYVAGLDDTINGQEAAAAVGRPPVQVTDSAGIEALFHALAVPAAQSAMREELVSWLNRVFAQTSHPLAASLLAEDL